MINSIQVNSTEPKQNIMEYKAKTIILQMMPMLYIVFDSVVNS